MLWQVVGFTFDRTVSPQQRADFEQSLSGLNDSIDDVVAVMVAPSVENADTTCFVSGFNNMDAFDRYLQHPAHLPVAEAAEALSTRITRLMFETPGNRPTLP